MHIFSGSITGFGFTVDAEPLVEEACVRVIVHVTAPLAGTVLSSTTKWGASGPLLGARNEEITVPFFNPPVLGIKLGYHSNFDWNAKELDIEIFVCEKLPDPSFTNPFDTRWACQKKRLKATVQ